MAIIDRKPRRTNVISESTDFCIILASISEVGVVGMPVDQIKKNLKNLSNQWEGKLLLANIASQLLSGVMTKSEIRSFLVKASQPSVPFNTIVEALSDQSDASGFKSTGLYFSSTKKVESTENVILLRVAPMKTILASVEFDGKEGNLRRSLVENYLDEICSTEKTDAEFVKQRTILLSECLFRDHGLTAPKNGWRLPEYIDGLDLAPGRIVSAGISLRTPNGEPTFFAPLPANGRGASLLKTLRSVGTPADYVRDILGLDHYAATHRGQRLVLGFYLVRANKIHDGKLSRPTPFDKSSPGRFRGSYGEHQKKVGKMGRTANLANIHACPADDDTPVGGLNEVVCPNHPLAAEDNRVLVGYLGPLAVPRGDTYKRGQNAKPADEKFLEICTGGCDIDAIIDNIIEGF
jgi:hypothetical protein